MHYWHGRLAAASLFALFALVTDRVGAQSPSPLPEPEVDLWVAGNIGAMVRQPDGGIIVGGNFSAINGNLRASIARLRPDGTLDPDWNPGANGTVSALAVDAAGRIYVGGNFTFIGGAARLRIARLEVGGADVADAAWNPGADAAVEAIAIDVGSGDAYIGGSFTQAGGLGRLRLARLSGQGNGAASAAWDVTADNVVTSLLVVGGNVYVGGYFTQIDGQPRNRLAMIQTNGVLDPAWNPDAAGNIEEIRSAGGWLYVAGNFAALGSQPIARLARVSLSGVGSVDVAWNPQVGGNVTTMALDNGNVYLGGGFTVVGGLQQPFMAKVQTSGNGAVDGNFRPGFDSSVTALAIGAMGQIVSGGGFTSVSGSQRLALAQLTDTGTLLERSDAESFGSVEQVLALTDGSLIVGGYFHKVNEQRRLHLLRLLPDGSLDMQWAPTANGIVEALARAPGGGVYVGGSFTHVNGESRPYLAKLQGTGTGELVAGWAPEFNRRIHALAATTSALYVGGRFNEIGGQLRSRIAKIGHDAQIDLQWNPGVDDNVYALAISGTQVYAGGDFTTAGGLIRNRLAKFAAAGAGTVDPVWHPDLDDTVWSLAADAAGRVYAGGSFATVGGMPWFALARFSAPNGEPDIDWDPLMADGVPVPGQMVRTILPASDGDVLIGGRFSRVSGLNVSNIAKISMLDAAADVVWNPMANGDVHSVAATSSGRFVAGGGFISIGGVPKRSLAMFPGDDTIFANGFQPADTGMTHSTR